MTAMDLIPPITEPMGRHWDQPRREDIIIDRQGRALLSRRDFNALHTYSATLPTGVYDGKMWKRELLTAPAFSGGHGTGVFELCWYGPSTDPTKCSIHRRPIVLEGTNDE